MQNVEVYFLHSSRLFKNTCLLQYLSGHLPRGRSSIFGRRRRRPREATGVYSNKIMSWITHRKVESLFSFYFIINTLPSPLPPNNVYPLSCNIKHLYFIAFINHVHIYFCLRRCLIMVIHRRKQIIETGSFNFSSK